MYIPVYMMPGMAASSRIFEYIKLPEPFKIFYLDWKIPKKNELLETYAQRLLEDIKHDNPVLIGVSFGGVIVQEIAKHIPCRKVIIISSIKSRYELPYRMRISRDMHLYNIAPVGLAKSIKRLSTSALPAKVKTRLALYKKYLSVDDPVYLRWALTQILRWPQEESMEGIVHIHGDADPVFPFKYIKDCICIPGGTHIMIITKYRWFNENLPQIIKN